MSIVHKLIGLELVQHLIFLHTVIDPGRFSILVDTTNYAAYQNGGKVKQVKQPITVNFVSPLSPEIVNYFIIRDHYQRKYNHQLISLLILLKWTGLQICYFIF